MSPRCFAFSSLTAASVQPSGTETRSNVLHGFRSGAVRRRWGPAEATSGTARMRTSVRGRSEASTAVNRRSAACGPLRVPDAEVVGVVAGLTRTY